MKKGSTPEREMSPSSIALFGSPIGFGVVALHQIYQSVTNALPQNSYTHVFTELIVETLGAVGKSDLPVRGRNLPLSDLPSKLVPPEAYGLVQRHRLFEKIRQAAPRSLVWIVAPPGAGKSCTAATWLHSEFAQAHPSRGIWYRLDETDADPALFFQILKRAVAHLPDAPVGELPALTPGALPALKDFTETWFEVLLRDENRGPYLFVFDDIHRLPPDAATLSILPILAGCLRTGDQVLCLSRQGPPDNVVARLPKSRLIQISDLQVQANEFEDFKRDLGHAEELTRSTFMSQLRQSGHWIADMFVAPASQLSLRQLARHPPSGLDELFADYSTTERIALLATGFLQVGHEGEWQALGGHEAVAMMTRLAEESSLVSRLVSGAVRKHDLFHDWLKAVAEATLTAADLKMARLHAGRLLVARDELLTGARLLLEADAQDEVRSLVLDQAVSLRSAGQSRVVLQLIAMLPDQTQNEPKIWILRAYARLPFEPGVARTVFAELWRSLDPRTDPVLYADAVYGEVRAALADWSIDSRLMLLVVETGASLDLMQNALEPARQQLIVARGLAMLYGEPTHSGVPDAQNELERILPLLPPILQLPTGSVLAYYFLSWRGCLDASRFHVNALRPLIESSDTPLLGSLNWYFAAAAVAFREGDGETLYRLVEEAKAFAQTWGISHRLSMIYWMFSQALAAEGNHADAAQVLQQYERTVRQSGRIGYSGPHTLRAALALSAGDHDGAISHAQMALDTAIWSDSPQGIGDQMLLLAMALAATGRDAARHAIDDLRDLALQMRNAVFVLHADLAEAFFAYAQGRMADFVRHWEHMAQHACDLKFRRITGMNLSYLSRLANEALALGADTRIIRSLVNLWRLRPPSDDQVHELWPYTVEIDCLGGFGISINGNRLRAGPGKAQRKPLELLWTLIIAHDRGIAQDLLADRLWPDLDGDRAMHTLRTTVYRLRKLLGPEMIVQEDDHVRLNLDHVATDFGRLKEALSRLHDAQLTEKERMNALDQAVRLYRGALLPGVAIEAVAVERARLEALLITDAIGFLMTLDPARPATALRAHRIQALFPHVRFPRVIAHLWSSEASEK
ncbi:hypothetical protein ACD578_27505 (plasmid) [Microvirga sp. RSM25]|uniref:hypothetical protein n=1 Tax=Microvirga sp. RSM25 TaxID=3273802 RepID=UPI00385088BA